MKHNAIYGAWRAVVVVLVVASANSLSHAETWTGPNADWNNAGSWGGTVPHGTGVVANFDIAPTASITTTNGVAGPFTVGSINYGNNSDIGNFSWTITNTNGLTLNQDSTGSDSAKI